MKFLLLSTTLTALILSTSAFGSADKHEESFCTMAEGATIVYGIYSFTPGVAVAVAGTIGVTSSIQFTEEMKTQAAKMLINDAQEFYQTGKVSINLQRSVDMVREENEELSESEAIDYLNQAAHSILQ